MKKCHYGQRHWRYCHCLDRKIIDLKTGRSYYFIGILKDRVAFRARQEEEVDKLIDKLYIMNKDLCNDNGSKIWGVLGRLMKEIIKGNFN